MGERIEGERKTRKHRNIDSLGDFDAWRCNRDNEKKEKKEKRVQARTSYRTLGAAVPDSVSHRNRRICFQGWVLCPTRPLMTVNYH